MTYQSLEKRIQLTENEIRASFARNSFLNANLYRAKQSKDDIERQTFIQSVILEICELKKTVSFLRTHLQLLAETISGRSRPEKAKEPIASFDLIQRLTNETTEKIADFKRTNLTEIVKLGKEERELTFSLVTYRDSFGTQTIPTQKQKQKQKLPKPIKRLNPKAQSDEKETVRQ